MNKREIRNYIKKYQYAVGSHYATQKLSWADGTGGAGKTYDVYTYTTADGEPIGDVEVTVEGKDSFNDGAGKITASAKCVVVTDDTFGGREAMANLESVSLDSSVTACTAKLGVTSDVSASIGFTGAISLKHFSAPGLNGIDAAAPFASCPALISVELPIIEYVGIGSGSIGSGSVGIVDGTSENAFNQCTSLESVDFPCLTSIGANMFEGCYNLKSASFAVVTIVKSTENCGSIGVSNAFAGCTSLTGVDMPNVEYIGEGAFAREKQNSGYIGILPLLPVIDGIQYNSNDKNVIVKCVDTSIESLASDAKVVYSEAFGVSGSIGYGVCIKSIDLPEAKQIGANAFNNCTCLESINMPKANVIDQGAFQNCSSLGSVDASSVTYIGNSAFSGCVELEDITLNDNVKINDGTFYACDSLPWEDGFQYNSLTDKVILLYWDADRMIATSNDTLSDANGIKQIACTFNGCIALKHVDLSYISELPEGMFENCTVLIDVKLDNVTNINHSLCRNCWSLESVSALSAIYISGSAFQACSSLAFFDAPNLTYVSNVAFQDCSSLTSFDAPNLIYVDYNTFQDCTSLASFDAPNLTYVGGSAFQDCSSLASFEASSLTFVDGIAFYSCSSLASFEAPNLTFIGGSAFAGCSSLASFDAPNLTYIDWSAFAGCSSLASFDAPNLTYVSSYAFAGCSSLASFEAQSLTYVGYSAFYSCSSLASFDAPNLTYVGDSAFDSCTSLTSFEAPNLTYVSNVAFQDCSSLTSFDASSLIFIGDQTFVACSSLTSFDAPNLNYVGYTVFFQCYALTSFVASNLTYVGDNAFGYVGTSTANGCDFIFDNETPAQIQSTTFSDARIHSIQVPASAVDTYKNATNWSTLASYITAIQ